MSQYRVRYLLPIIGSVLLLCCQTIFAGGADIPLHREGPYFSLFGGVNWIKSGESTEDVNLGGLTTNRYEADRSSVAGSIVGGDAGYLWLFPRRHLFVSLGLETSYSTITSNPGLVRPLFFVNPNFDTLDFTYRISVIPILTTLQFGWSVNKWFNPYFIGGLGISINHASNYNEVPTNPDGSATPMRNMYRDRTQVEFAYSVGTGLLFKLMRRVQLGLEYRFTDNGNASLNPTVAQTTNERLSIGDVYSNSLLMRLVVRWAA